MSPAIPYVSLRDAAAALNVTPDYLRHAAVDGRAIAIRLGLVKLGRDWACPKDTLEREVARRAPKNGTVKA